MPKRKRRMSFEDALQELQTPGGSTVGVLVKRVGVCHTTFLRWVDRAIGKKSRQKSVRARQSESMKVNTRALGRKFPEAVKQRWKVERRGSKNPNWKDGGDRRHLEAYKAFVAMVIDRDGGACVKCGSDRALVVHHKISSNEAPELLMDFGNVETLCRSCHANEHDLGSKGS